MRDATGRRAAFWEEYFELVRVQDAHHRSKCRDENGMEPWACCDCDCTEKLERHLGQRGREFLDVLHKAVATGLEVK